MTQDKSSQKVRGIIQDVINQYKSYPLDRNLLDMVEQRLIMEIIKEFENSIINTNGEFMALHNRLRVSLIGDSK